MIQVGQIVIVGGFDDQRRGARAIIKRGMFDMARTWHRKFLPGHFKPSADRIYGYAPREHDYEEWKGKTKGHANSLMWSGRTRAQAMALYHVTGSATKVTGKLTVPSYIRMKRVPHYFRGRRYVLPAMGLEMTRVTRREIKTLSKRLHRQVVAGLRAIRTRKVIKV